MTSAPVVITGAQLPAVNDLGRPRAGVRGQPRDLLDRHAAVIAGGHLSRAAAVQVLFAATMIVCALGQTLLTPAGPVITGDRARPGAAGRRKGPAPMLPSPSACSVRLLAGPRSALTGPPACLVPSQWPLPSPASPPSAPPPAGTRRRPYPGNGALRCGRDCRGNVHAGGHVEPPIWRGLGGCLRCVDATRGVICAGIWRLAVSECCGAVR
jgi:hypothetical protein